MFPICSFTENVYGPLLYTIYYVLSCTGTLRNSSRRIHAVLDVFCLPSDSISHLLPPHEELICMTRSGASCSRLGVASRGTDKHPEGRREMRLGCLFAPLHPCSAALGKYCPSTKRHNAYRDLHTIPSSRIQYLFPPSSPFFRPTGFGTLYPL